MGFWGIEIKPGKKVDPYEGCDTPGRLRITQATLGNGSSTEKSILQCYYGEHKGAVNLCSLLPDKIESSLLDLEIEEDDGLDFSVSGSRSIHLSGYFLPEEDVEDGDDADYGSSDEDAAPMCCSDSDCSEFDSEDDYDVVDSDESDLDMYSPKKSGVVIEEITDDQDASKGNSKPKLLKYKSGKSEKNLESQQEVVARSNSGPVLESEDEDGFPTSNSQKSERGDNQKKDGNVNSKSKKREMKTMELDDESDRQTKKKKKKQKKMDKEENDHKEASDGDEMVVGTEHKPKEVTNGAAKPSALEPSNVNAPSENDAEKKKKKKNKKKKSEESKEGTNGNQPASTVASEDDKKTELKASQVRTFPNGMIVEELQMGKPDGKKAAPGKQIAVHYIGKLKKNGNIFDSNVGRAPFKFRLGVGQVIKGWDVGVNGMRVGDKRRLTLPPSMGYGAKGAGGKIPPNAWLMFDVELVDVR